MNKWKTKGILVIKKDISVFLHLFISTYIYLFFYLYIYLFIYLFLKDIAKEERLISSRLERVDWFVVYGSIGASRLWLVSSVLPLLRPPRLHCQRERERKGEGEREGDE